MTRATHVGLGLAGVLLVVLIASGVWLWWDYRPGPDQWIRDAHQVAADALVVVAVVLVVVAILQRARSRVPGVVAACGVLVTVAGACITGRLLPWDQLALSAVTVDVGGGVDAVLTNPVKFVLIDGRELSPAAYDFWAYSHLALTVLVAVALVLVWFRTRDLRPVDAEEPVRSS